MEENLRSKLLEEAIDRLNRREQEEDQRNRPALELLVRAIEDVLPQLRSSPLVTEMANDLLDIFWNCLYGLVAENPFRAGKAGSRDRARRAAYASHSSHNVKRREIQAAWLELERARSKKSKAKFAAEMADKHALSFETVRRWLRDSELKAARNRIKITKVAPNPKSGPSMQA